MKFFIAFALFATVASAANIKPNQVRAEVADIVSAIRNPSTDPATAAAPEALLETSPIAFGPPLIAIPLSDGDGVTAKEHPVIPAADTTPLVQIFIVSVGTNAASSPITVGPDGTGRIADEANVPGNVNTVDHVIAPGPVIVPGPTISPIQVVE